MYKAILHYVPYFVTYSIFSNKCAINSENARLNSQEMQYSYKDSRNFTRQEIFGEASSPRLVEVNLGFVMQDYVNKTSGEKGKSARGSLKEHARIHVKLQTHNVPHILYPHP